MSLFEIDYTSNTAHEHRLKEQQEQIMNALQELSIKVKLQTQKSSSVENKREEPENYSYKKSYTALGDKNIMYSPYYDNSIGKRIARPSLSSQWSVPLYQSNSSVTTQRTSSVSTAALYEENTEHSNDSDLSATVCDMEQRDVYGFKKPTQCVSIERIEEIEQQNELIMKKQRRRWQKLSTNTDVQWPARCHQFLRWVKNGIPREMKPEVWINYSNTSCKIEQNPELYKSLLEKAIEMGKSNEYAIIIQRDLHRTFPDNPFFFCSDDPDINSILASPQNTSSKIQKLHRVLLAFSVHSPEIGYCQSFNFLTGLLVILFEEEQAFWMLHTIVYDFFPRNMFDTQMEGANIEQTVLTMLIYEKMPGVWAKIANRKCFWECEKEDCLPPITLVTNHWFMTLFINILPIETVLHIWDCFFAGEGFKILYQVALTIIKLNEESIWNAEDSIEAFQILQNMPKTFVDSHDFMKTVFSPSGIASDITMQDVNRRRDLFRDRKRERKSHQKRK
ncbi:unnamed protein product [Rhizopus stolonifer]